MIRIGSAALTATISPRGAELQSLTDRQGRGYLWDGDAAWWGGRSPILFPVIGVVNGGTIRVDGRAYTMPKHGVVRHRDFALVEAGDSAATFRLEADAETLAAYPFEFALEVSYRIEDATLAMQARVENRGAAAMPASFGFHPAFRWPLPGGERDGQRLVFEHAEHEPIRRIDPAGQLQARTFPSPIVGDTLTLEDGLFEEDALILDGLWSRAATLESPGARSLRIEWPGMPLLGVWTKPGAPFICIEPWQGVADPQGYAGEFRDKPGVVEIPPEGSRTFEMRVTLA
ncbi:aldose 1-epimerase family protein [Sphingomonas jatrophae]|uniref:Galactose mutarotase n=1 Tax=Sphingomonas jatrophae TaxID=1166337 RepID=A0A1I6JUW5_9SPHN|nr:aldose 1-epimerase family protein [Sphingomonas jatrophae]SFR82772.1 Galactose mutarotase [Sphingomonas jatrophae]